MDATKYVQEGPHQISERILRAPAPRAPLDALEPHFLRAPDTPLRRRLDGNRTLLGCAPFARGCGALCREGLEEGRTGRKHVEAQPAPGVRGAHLEVIAERALSVPGIRRVAPARHGLHEYVLEMRERHVSALVLVPFRPVFGLGRCIRCGEGVSRISRRTRCEWDET